MGQLEQKSSTVEPRPSDSDLLGAVVSSSYYEIRVAGVLPPEVLLDFDRLTASVEPVETVVHGQIRDQAALQGLKVEPGPLRITRVEVRSMGYPPAEGWAGPLLGEMG